MSIYSMWQNYLPGHQFVKVGDQIGTVRDLPPALHKSITLHLHPAQPGNGAGREVVLGPGEKGLVGLQPGQLEMQMKLFNFLPLHRMTVSVVAPPKVYPGGHSIGILMHTEGVMVVGEAPVIHAGRKHFPAREAGIRVGDLIIRVNGVRIQSESQLLELIDLSGSKGRHVLLLVKHGGKVVEKRVSPVLCDKTGRYRVGLFVKGTAAGVGTLTFYEPRSGTYGALGHIIADTGSGQAVNLSNGRIVDAAIKALHPGQKGHPGEKMGVFKSNSEIAGSIDKNTVHGIFGKMERHTGNPYFSRPVPVALKYQLHEGPAEIYTVLRGNKIERFNIYIEKVLPGGEQGKEMIIRVCDPALVNSTGGIIQGMSGSPIIQDGRLAGAVTHVFINDPTRGYGVSAENMLKEANLINIKQVEKLAS